MGALTLASALVASGCGADEPKSAASLSDFETALQGAPKPLAELYSRPAEVVGGGVDAYRRQLERLRGRPVVVNKWASWCGPCRFEFPFFQRQALEHGTEIAFLGVDSRDSREDAERFLRKYPVPYPSFFDPEGDIASEFRGDRVAPSTAFYDASGELVYTKPGGYPSEDALAKHVARYARPRGGEQ